MYPHLYSNGSSSPSTCLFTSSCTTTTTRPLAERSFGFVFVSPPPVPLALPCARTPKLTVPDVFCFFSFPAPGLLWRYSGRSTSRPCRSPSLSSTLESFTLQARVFSSPVRRLLPPPTADVFGGLFAKVGVVFQNSLDDPYSSCSCFGLVQATVGAPTSMLPTPFPRWETVLGLRELLSLDVLSSLRTFSSSSGERSLRPSTASATSSPFLELLADFLRSCFITLQILPSDLQEGCRRPRWTWIEGRPKRPERFFGRYREVDAVETSRPQHFFAHPPRSLLISLDSPSTSRLSHSRLSFRPLRKTSPLARLAYLDTLRITLPPSSLYPT
jgi:hypothetical protein